MTFRQFLLSLRDENSPCGDFARDALDWKDEEVLRAKSLRAILTAMSQTEACSGAYEAAKETWARYRALSRAAR
jgi:hypothetical protein